ncbi:MAG: type II toxin-antitoxin system VapC family toxin [Bdellovibrionota bacterium]
MKHLLDTHVLLWWYGDSERLAESHRRILSTAQKTEGAKVALSIMSFWEIAKLVALKKISFSGSLDGWFRQLERDPFFEVLPLTAEIVLESNRLGDGFHRDPVDQILVATARCHGLRFLSVDERIRKSGLVLVE